MLIAAIHESNVPHERVLPGQNPIVDRKRSQFAITMRPFCIIHRIYVRDRDDALTTPSYRIADL